jgi:hypothetical protein
MKIGLILKPGQKGTKKLTQQYGNRLIYVRYRYDNKRKKRLKTIELIIDEREWEPGKNEISENEIVYIRINLMERQLQKKVKTVGGVWNRNKKVWELSYRQVLNLGLEERIVETSDNIIEG